MINLKDIIPGKLYTDKDRKPFQTNEASIASWSDDKKTLRWKVYIDGEKEPLILTGRSANEVKKFAHQMINNNSVKIKKVVKEEKINERWDSPQAYSSQEAKNIIDNELKIWAKDLRKVQHNVIKAWMKAAKSGAIDFFDLIRGLKTGDIARAYPYETEFLHAVLTRDKIIDRFRSYFGGKKGKPRKK